jgi:HemY protein
VAEKVNRQKNSSEPAGSAPAGQPRGHAPRRWLATGLVLALAILGLFAVKMALRPGLSGRVQAGLPALPDLTGKPPVLREQLTKADARAKLSSDPLAGVTELGRLYHANGYNLEAEACWRLLHAEQPREGRWCYYLADLRRVASDYDEMTVLLAQTVKLAPDYAPALLQLAGLQFKTGHFDDAARKYQQRLVLLPGDPYARLWLARIALQRGERAEARRLIEQLLKDTPAFSSGHNLYAEMLTAEGDIAGADRQRWLGRETGRFREAADPWLDSLQTWCYDYERLCAMGTMEYQTLHCDRAEALYNRAIQIRPADPAGYELLGGLFLKLKDPAKARDTLEQCRPKLGAAQPSVMFYLNLSQAYRDLKQPADAVRVARQGLVFMGENLELYSILGTALGDLGQPGAAIDALHKAIALNPNDADANFNLGRILLALDRMDEARAALVRSLTLQPTFPQALTLLGQLELEAGRWEAAEKYLRPLFESHPEMPEARLLMANWHLRAGAAAEAKKDLAAAECHYRDAAAMESHPETPEARLAMANWHLRAGTAAEAKKDLAAAERHYRDGMALNQNHPELQANLGALCLAQGRFADALGPLESYHRLQPDNPQSCLFLGLVYAAIGRRDEARRMLTEGIQTAERTGNAVTAKHCREILSQL